MKKSKLLLIGSLAVSALGLAACKKKVNILDEMFIDSNSASSIQNINAIYSKNPCEVEYNILIETNDDSSETYINLISGNEVARSNDIVAFEAFSDYYYVIKKNEDKFNHSIYGYSNDHQILSFDDERNSILDVKVKESEYLKNGSTITLNEYKIDNVDESKFYISTGTTTEYHTESPIKLSNKFGRKSASELGLSKEYYYDSIKLGNDEEKIYFYDADDNLVSTFLYKENISGIVFFKDTIIYQELDRVSNSEEDYDCYYSDGNYYDTIKYRVNSYKFNLKNGKTSKLGLDYIIGKQIQANENAEYAAIEYYDIEGKTKKVDDAITAVAFIDKKGKIKAQYKELCDSEKLDFRLSNGGFYINKALYNSNLELITYVDGAISNDVYYKNVDERTILVNLNGDILKTFEGQTLTVLTNGLINVSDGNSESYYEVTLNEVKELTLANNESVYVIDENGLYSIIKEVEEGIYEYYIKSPGCVSSFNVYSSYNSLQIDVTLSVNNKYVYILSTDSYLDLEMINKVQAIRIEC